MGGGADSSSSGPEGSGRQQQQQGDDPWGAAQDGQQCCCQHKKLTLMDMWVHGWLLQRPWLTSMGKEVGSTVRCCTAQCSAVLCCCQHNNITLMDMYVGARPVVAAISAYSEGPGMEVHSAVL